MIIFMSKNKHREIMNRIIANEAIARAYITDSDAFMHHCENSAYLTMEFAKSIDEVNAANEKITEITHRYKKN